MLFIDIMLVIIGVSVFGALKLRDQRYRQKSERDLRVHNELVNEFNEKNVEKREDWWVYDDIRDFCFWLGVRGEMVSPIEATEEVKEYYDVAYEIAQKTNRLDRIDRLKNLSGKDWVQVIMEELALGARLGKVREYRKDYGYYCGENEIALWVYKKSHDKFVGRLLWYHCPKGVRDHMFWEYGNLQYLPDMDRVTAVEI